MLLPSPKMFSSRKAWEDTCWKKLAELPNILQFVTTATERRNLIYRAAALDRLRAGARLRQLAKELQLSRQTISAIKKAMNESGYRSRWVRDKTERKKKIYTSSLTHRTRAHRRRNHGRRLVKTKYGTINLP